MQGTLFDHPLVPIASEEDAVATARALSPYLDGDRRVTLLHVIEKAGGALDKASVEQRRAEADEIFAAAREHLEGTGAQVETTLEYGTDVSETIVDTADEIDATAVVFTPRGGSKWVKLLTGDVATSLVEESHLPVVTLPDVGETDG